MRLSSSVPFPGFSFSELSDWSENGNNRPGTGEAGNGTESWINQGVLFSLLTISLKLIKKTICLIKVIVFTKSNDFKRKTILFKSKGDCKLYIVHFLEDTI